MNTSFVRCAAVLAAVACSVVFSSPARAIDKCRIKVDKTGVITVDASGVSGPLRWGATAGSESQVFFNDGTCVADGKAKKCQLANPATLAAKTPPAGCTVYLDDDGTPCSGWIRGCSAGARQSAGLLVKDAAGVTVGLADEGGSYVTVKDASAFVQIPLTAAGAFGVNGYEYFLSADCSGAALLSPATGLVAYGQLFGPSGPAHYPIGSGSTQSPGSARYATVDFVDQAACDTWAGPGNSTFLPPTSCCTLAGGSQPLTTTVSLDLSGFTAPLHLEEQ